MKKISEVKKMNTINFYRMQPANEINNAIANLPVAEKMELRAGEDNEEVRNFVGIKVTDASGGSCFVKDINAMIYQSQKLGVNPQVMLGAWNKNLEVRQQRDWEKLQGRAVSSGE